MRNNEKGFSVIEILVVLVVIGLVGTVSWLVYDRQQNRNSKNEEVTDTVKQVDVTNKEDVTQEPKDETEEWVSFTPKSGLYTIKLPDGWTFLHQNDDCDCLSAQTMNFKAGTPASIEKIQGGRDSASGFFVAADDRDRSAERFNGFQKQGTIKAGNLEGTKYYYEQTTEQEGLGPEKGEKIYSYYFVKNGKGIYISYSLKPGATNNLETVEKSIKSLR